MDHECYLPGTSQNQYVVHYTNIFPRVTLSFLSYVHVCVCSYVCVRMCVFVRVKKTRSVPPPDASS